MMSRLANLRAMEKGWSKLVVAVHTRPIRLVWEASALSRVQGSIQAT